MLKSILKTSAPIILSYLGIMAMGFVDMIFIGRVGAEATGSVAIGNSISAWVMIFGIGVLSALDYLVSFNFGAQKKFECGRLLFSSWCLALTLGVPAIILIWITSNCLGLMGINGDIQPGAQIFLKIISFSMPFLFLFAAMRNFLQAAGRPNDSLYILLFGNIINILLNAVLVGGLIFDLHWGPGGSALATFGARIVMCLMSLYLVLRWLSKENIRLWDIVHFDFSLAKNILTLGVWSGLQTTMEVGIFVLSTVMAGSFTASIVAGHQIALNLASITFMVPLGLGSSAAVLIGQELGRNNLSGARHIGNWCTAIGFLFMSVTGSIFYVFGSNILKIYTTDASVIAVGVSIIGVAAFFQIFDGVQAVLTGVLRGWGDTKSPVLWNLIGHWLIGLPLGLYLGFNIKWGLFGIWVALASGLVVVSCSLLVIYLRRIRTRQVQ